MPPPSTASKVVKKAYERRGKKVFVIIAMNLVAKESAYIKGYKKPV